MNSRVLRFGVVGIIVLLVGVLVVRSLTPHGLVVEQSYAVPTGFSSATAFGNNTLAASNGRAFISYNYVTGRSTSLSQDRMIDELANIDTLSASDDHKYLLFHNEHAVSGGELDATLQGLGLDESQDYWWLYSINSDAYTPLPHDTLRAKFDGNSVRALTSAPSGESIVTIQNATGRQSSSFSIPGSSDFFPALDGVLLESPDNTVLFTKDGVVNQTLYKDTVVVGVTPDKHYAIGITGQDESRRLTELNLQKKTLKTIASGVVGQPVWLNTGVVLYTTNPSQGGSQVPFFTYSATTHHQDLWNNKFLNGKTTSFTPASLVGETAAIITDGQNNTQLIGKGLFALKNATATYQQTITVADNTGYLHYDTGSREFEATFDNPPSKTDIDATYQSLRASGYNPDIISLRFAAAAGE